MSDVSSISRSTVTVKNMCARNVTQAGGASSSNIDKLAIKIHDVLKEKYVNHGNRVKDFSDLTFNDIVGDNVNYVLTCRFHRLKSIRMPKGWTNKDEWNKESNECLPLSTIMKYFGPLFAMLQSCWHNHPNLKGAQDNRPQWWLNLRNNLQKAMKK